MIFKLFNTFIALAAIAVASAMPYKRQDQGDLASCVFVLTPDAPVAGNLERELNFVIGDSLAIAAGNGIFIDNVGVIITDVEDNNFTAQDDLSVDGKTAAETAAILTGFTGETKPGMLANWLFDSVNCA
ncbi:hypothetical protein VKT23_007759 [Stygiomarasmius scandens]|uniref:Uncharacterized protein n=1 Tax=Marasmiellus scandens TaxID=2682957 RepID=A0ABR1JLL7_9AGAR